MKEYCYYNSSTYYCHRCKHAHHEESLVGRKHIKFASEEVRKQVFKKLNVY